MKSSCRLGARKYTAPAPGAGWLSSSSAQCRRPPASVCRQCFARSVFMPSRSSFIGEMGVPRAGSAHCPLDTAPPVQSRSASDKTVRAAPTGVSLAARPANPSRQRARRAPRSARSAPAARRRSARRCTGSSISSASSPNLVRTKFNSLLGAARRAELLRVLGSPTLPRWQSGLESIQGGWID